ncbi:hypothetical protein ACE6H2_019206 [Prunus campanulata]
MSSSKYSSTTMLSFLSAEESENLKTTIKPQPPDKDWYLYVKLEAQEKNLCRLNISNLCKRSCRNAPRFETVFDRVLDHDGWMELGEWVKQASRHMIVGSKLYRVRGEFDTRFSKTHSFIHYESMGFKSSVECYDLTHHDSTDEEFPSMRVCDKDVPI